MIKKFFYSILFTLFALSVNAQVVKIEGTVVDTNNSPLVGVSVVVPSTTIGAVTDLEGKFTINAPRESILNFSSIGMVTQERQYNGKPLVVVMVIDSKAMDEVVVIGYQTIKKSDLTGAVSIFNPDKMKNAVVTGTVGDALASVPGLLVRSAGKPGGEGFVEVRGTATFGSSKPLYIIDGTPVDGGANRDFNFNDVESIQVLKDASAAAIYGSRAANGVIIITTKQGKSGDMKINVSSKLTLQWLPRFDFMGRDEWIEMNDLAFTNAGRVPVIHSDGDTDWQEETFKMGLIQDHNVSFSGGGESSKYFLSINYQENTGATIGTSSQRFTARSNTSSERQFGDNVTFRIGENIILSNYTVDELNTNPIVDVYRMLPTIPVYNENNLGGFGYGDGTKDVTFGVNPVAKEFLTETVNKNFRVRGNAFAELEFFKQLKYRFNVGFEHSTDSHSYLQKAGFWTYNQPNDPTVLNKNKANSHSLVFDNILEWTKSYGKHDIAAIGGISYTTNSYEQLWGSKSNVMSSSDGYFGELDAALSSPKTGSYKDINKLFSYFGRINYTYDNRYLFSATIRRDESSKFGPNFRAGSFPSVSAGWRISEESFFDASWVDELKVRANYGILGSSNIGNYDWVPFINIFPQAVFGTSQNISSGMTQVKLSNPDLKWEELHQMNIGADLRLFRNKLGISVDYYVKETQDILTPMQILMTTGNNGGNPLVNAATLLNSGFEIAATWNQNHADFRYGIDFSVSYLKNEIKELGYGRKFFNEWHTQSHIGGSIGEWYLIKTDGLFRTEEEVLNHVDSNGALIQPDAKPGDMRYLDYNDDGQITDADRQYAGQSVPSWHLNLGLNFEYKGLDLMLQFSSSLGHKIFNGPRSAFDMFNDNHSTRSDYDAFDAVTNPAGKDPRPIYGDGRNSRGNQDRWLESGNYLRLSQVAIGYALPKKLLGEHIDGVRIFVAGQNLVTLTGYSGLDPQFAGYNIWARSHDNGEYPTPLGVTCGATITF